MRGSDEEDGRNLPVVHIPVLSQLTNTVSSDSHIDPGLHLAFWEARDQFINSHFLFNCQKIVLMKILRLM